MKLVEIDDDLWVAPCHVAAVKKVDKKRCAVWMAGQSAVDGSFLIERPAQDVVDDLNSAEEDE